MTPRFANSMKLQICVFILMLLSIPSLGAAQELNSFVSASSGGLKLTAWIEAPDEKWETLSVCCRMTNHSGAVHKAEYGGLKPPFFVVITDRFGNVLNPRPGKKRSFAVPGAIHFSSYLMDIKPNESAETRFDLMSSFEVQDPAVARIAVSWQPQNGSSLELKVELQLPDEPKIITRPTDIPPIEPKDLSKPQAASRDQSSSSPRSALPPKLNVSDAKPALPRNSQPISRPRLVWTMVICVAIGLLSLLLKKRRT